MTHKIWNTVVDCSLLIKMWGSTHTIYITLCCSGLGIDSDQYDDGLYEEPVPMERNVADANNYLATGPVASFDLDSGECSGLFSSSFCIICSEFAGTAKWTSFSWNLNNLDCKFKLFAFIVFNFYFPTLLVVGGKAIGAYTLLVVGGRAIGTYCICGTDNICRSDGVCYLQLVFKLVYKVVTYYVIYYSVRSATA